MVFLLASIYSDIHWFTAIKRHKVMSVIQVLRGYAHLNN